MSYGIGIHCKEGLLTWCGVSSNTLVLPEPSLKRVIRYERHGMIPLRVLLGVFDIFWECTRRVARAKTDKVELIKLPMKGCGDRKQKIDELIKLACRKRDLKRVLELRMMCHVFQAEEIAELYAGLMNHIIGGLPKMGEKFFEWLKRLHSVGMFEYKTGRDGWKYAKRISEF